MKKHATILTRDLATQAAPGRQSPSREAASWQPHDSRLMAAPSGQAASISWFWYFTRFTSVTSRPSWILKGKQSNAQRLLRCLI